MTDWSLAARAGCLALTLVTFQPAVALDPSDLLSHARAAPPDLRRGAALYSEHCSRCHDARGSGAGERQFPQLAAQQREYLLDELVQFVSLERRAPTMHRVLMQSAVADPQSISDLSAYLAAQPRDPHPEHGDAHRLGRGRELYHERCAQCHGALGGGDPTGPVPAVGGQNYTYLVRQLHGFATGHRSKASPELIDAMGKLSADDILAVADFLSRLPQSADADYGAAP